MIFLPLVASVFPNTTVRLFEDAGWNPAGVKAVAAPASTTKRRDEDNIIEAKTVNDHKCKRYQQEQLKNINGNAKRER